VGPLARAGKCRLHGRAFSIYEDRVGCGEANKGRSALQYVKNLSQDSKWLVADIQALLYQYFSQLFQAQLGIASGELYPPQCLVSNSSSVLMLPHAVLQGRLCGCGLRAACISECRRASQRESAMLTCTRKLTPLLRILARRRLN
jgi:hypothetical protein